MAVVVVALVAGLVPVSAYAGVEELPVNTVPPSVSGEPVYRGKLVADPGEWTPPDGLTYRYQWFRGGEAIRNATRRTYRPRLGDLRRRLRVEVEATNGTGGSGTASSEPTDRVRRARFDVKQRPRISGTRRYTHVLEVHPGRWSPRTRQVTYRWFRDGRAIRGAQGRRYRLGHEDVGHRITARVTLRKPGYRTSRTFSRPTGAVLHRVPARRTATYRIETRGRITASMKVFRRQVAETLADPRGWRSAGVAFKRVARGGAFSVVLAEASTVPSFHPICSAQWSCRVGRYVVINQMRWQHATPSWNSANKSLRSYRHMVLNHETGHWLGHGHLGCPGRGQLAPVMMQQSKGLDGCRHNPWPLPSERWHR
ncbi:DUF3152 domain-containing protein [Nocardioides coralli]|uniref:DUF3152 domain-containing protein n=1 Tax=Nocardioides coralli TaxID=2872154 RepID=UPI001CA44EE3|nr:DUF3152 domain-containing protein [Nocardioides coralli]QZY28373.1 DUF3152 domain-containing protein [Nocardioides coralli]